MLKRILFVFLICLLLNGCGGTEPGELSQKQVVTAVTSEFWHDMSFEQLHLTNQHAYDYDEYGRLVYEKWITNGETSFTSRYFWSRDGLECTEISFDHQKLIPWPSSRVKEVYDENGKEVEKIVYEFFSVSQRSISNYDDAGKLIRLEVTDGDGSMTILQEYTYDERGNQLKTVDLSEAGKECVTEYTYDENGNQLSWHYRENGVLQEYVEIAYDDQGRKVFSARYDGSGEQKHYWEYTYSADGRTVTTSYSGERTTIDYYEESGLLVRSESYDADGNLTSVSTYTYETNQVKQEPNP